MRPKAAANLAGQMERRALATFVAPVESQSTVQRATVERERGFGLLLVSVLTWVAMAVHGYHPYAEDGGLYMAGVKRLLDPALYPQGTAFVLEPMRHSLFAPLVAGIVKLTGLGLPWVLLALDLASIWATLFAVWMLAARCWSRREERAGVVVLLTCWLTLPVAGTALFLMDPYVTARSLSTPCTLLALAGVLDMSNQDTSGNQRRRGLCLWFGSIAIAALVHPLMAVYGLWATLTLVCLRLQRRGARFWGTAALSAAALAIAAALQYAAKPEDPDYVHVALTRTYWFPGTWAWYEWVGLAAPVVILAAFARASSVGSAGRALSQGDTARSALAQMALSIGVTATAIALLFARAGAPTHVVARLQPLRAFQIVYLAMILFLGSTMGRVVLRRSAWRWAAAIVLLGGIMARAGFAAFPNSNHLELPGASARNPWVQSFLWIRENTPHDALFALDSDYINARGEDAQSFRAIAERSALPDYSKDGGETSIAPNLTAAWSIGQAAQERLSSPTETDAQRIAALSPLGVSWIVLEASAATSLNCPYASSAVRVCRLP
jgi:hypothetical protein